MSLTNQIVAGVDEVGRGALFGPVFAGAVVLNREGEKLLLQAGLKDSKKLTARKRGLLVPIIQEHCLFWGLGQASSKEVDLIGIRLATEKAMVRALNRLEIKVEMVLVDGSLPLSLWSGPQKSLIKGEDISPSIAAASVLAKEARDELIKQLAIRFPGYGLETHVGYGTKVHRKAISEKGLTELHRKTFLSKVINKKSSES